ncbi:MAG TPA: hypothetical protein DCS93_32745 [Microscillaceae bacterium]|nr:hypothetical protein [Microscillaceae bacterium]
MTTEASNGFLGTVSEQIQHNDCRATIVDYHQPVSEEWHHHDNVVLCLILRGGTLESRKKTETQAIPGKVMLYNQGEVHRNTHTQFPSKNLNLELEETFFSSNDLQSVNFDKAFVKSLDLHFQLLKIYQELNLNDTYSNQALYASLLALFGQKTQKLPNAPWLKNLEEVLADRWNEFISLKELSRELNLHPVTISRYFPKYFGCSLGDYMRKLKVERALFYLQHTLKPLTEIAYECGFADQSHFIRVFKAYTGFTPKAFKIL